MSVKRQFNPEPVKLWTGKTRARVRLCFQLAAAVVTQGLQPGRAHAEDHADYRFGFYGEEGGRIEVITHSAFFEQQLGESVTAKATLIYDGISGASPSGSPPLAGGKQVPLVPMEEIRRAANLGFDIKWGPQTLSPQFAYSKESDYESVGISLNDAIELNQKNTTLRFGVAHSFDRVEPASFKQHKNKDTTDFLVGFSQLLSPKTILTADFTYGVSDGYLDDPYKQVRFDGWLPLTFVFPEVRPGHRTREVVLLTLTQFIDPLNGSAEVSYRFHHDSFGVNSHTVGLTWHQKIGSRVVVEPIFRYYQQSAADFYRLSVPGLAPGDGNPARPKYYSADYRLAHMESYTYGLQVTARITDWLSLDAGYQRYEMFGLDGKTADSMFPKAHIVNVGFRLWF